MSTRYVVVGFVLIVALLTGSVLLIGYVAAAASLLAVLMLLVKRAIRRESTVPIRPFVPRWVRGRRSGGSVTRHLIGRTESLVHGWWIPRREKQGAEIGRTNNQLMELLACVSQTS